MPGLCPIYTHPDGGPEMGPEIGYSYPRLGSEKGAKRIGGGLAEISPGFSENCGTFILDYMVLNVGPKSG